MPFGLCFYMENIFTSDDITDAATVFIVCSVVIPFSKQGVELFYAWSDRKEMQFSSKRIYNKKKW